MTTATEKTSKAPRTTVTGHPSLKNTLKLSQKQQNALNQLLRAATSPIISRQDFMELRTKVSHKSYGSSFITKNRAFQFVARAQSSSCPLRSQRSRRASRSAA
jgi:hypothetical protein